jgi:type IV pilus assembly protein PilA
MRKRAGGFTLIEIMIVVAIIGILAAIAIPTFMGFMKKTKTSEAALNLNKIGKNLKAEYQSMARFPTADGALLPAAGSGPGKNCCGGGAGATKDKCVPQPSAFKDGAGWEDLEFAVGEPSQYQYAYKGGTNIATAYAVGDLDCNNVSATWTLTATGTPDGTSTVLSEPPHGIY